MKTIYALIILLIVSACATSPTGRSQFMLVSPEEAISASEEAYVQTLLPLHRQGKINKNRANAQRVRNITGKIIAQAIQLFPESRDWQWSVKVIEDPKEVNAWCMAGGRMAVYSGLIEKVKPTDDELAQVMGHEISHALANHTAEKMSMALATRVGLQGLSMAVGGGAYANAALSGTALAAQLAVNLPNNRTAESEADQMGIELAARAGYDPRAAVTLWQKMAKVGGSSPPQFLSTHPSPQNRQLRLQELAKKVMPYYLQKGSRPIYPLK